MNAEIKLVLAQLEASYHRQRTYLADKPTAVLADLKHECESLRNDPSTLVRVAAGINQAACEVIEEERQKGAKS